MIKLIPLIITLSFVTAHAYNPPIGIPDPGLWGNTHPIDTAAPNTTTKCPSWPGSTSTGCYYIDNTAAGCDDDDDGSPSDPRCTIPTASYSAGAYIELHGGPYAVTPTLVANGTSAAPIWFRGTSDSLPTLTGKLTFSSSKYLIIEYLDFNGGNNGCLFFSGSATNNISIRNSKFRNRTWLSNAAAIGAVPDAGGSTHDIVVYNNLFHNLGNWEATEDQDFHGFNPNLTGRTIPTEFYNVWALDNTGYYISGNLIQTNGYQQDVYVADNEVPVRDETNLDNFHHMYAGRNVGHHNRQDVVDMKLTTDGIISQNESYSNYNNAANGGTGAVFQEGPNYLWIIFNKFHDLQGEGIRQSNMLYTRYQTHKTFMIGNVIYNITKTPEDPDGVNSRYKSGQGITFEKGNHKRYIIDNTIVNVAGGLSTVNAVATDTIDASGNVIAGLSGYDTLSRADYHISNITGNVGLFSTDYNFFQPRDDNGEVRFYWGGVSKTTLATYQSSYSQCTNCWSGDPLFVNAAAANFRPTSESPLRGKGVKHTAYDEFYSRYGISIDVDFSGAARSATGRTLGAYEYTDGVPVPIKVRGFRISAQ